MNVTARTREQTPRDPDSIKASQWRSISLGDEWYKPATIGDLAQFIATKLAPHSLDCAGSALRATITRSFTQRAKNNFCTITKTLVFSHHVADVSVVKHQAVQLIWC